MCTRRMPWRAAARATWTGATALVVQFVSAASGASDPASLVAVWTIASGRVASISAFHCGRAGYVGWHPLDAVDRRGRGTICPGDHMPPSDCALTDVASQESSRAGNEELHGRESDTLRIGLIPVDRAAAAHRRDRRTRPRFLAVNSPRIRYEPFVGQHRGRRTRIASSAHSAVAAFQSLGRARAIRPHRRACMPIPRSRRGLAIGLAVTTAAVAITTITLNGANASQPGAASSH